MTAAQAPPTEQHGAQRGADSRPAPAPTAHSIPAGGTWFRPRRTRGQIGVLSLTRLLVIEVMIGVVFFVVLQGIVAMIVGDVLGLIVLVAVFGRSRGTWWSDRFMLWVRYKLRSGSTRDNQADPRLAALRELAPGLAIDDITDASDNSLGMAGDGAGWFAVVEIATTGVDGPFPPVPMSALAKIADEAEQSGVLMQVVSHSATEHGGLGRTNVIWVAIRLDAYAVAESMIDHTDSRVDIPAVLAEITHRVERLLRKQGLVVKTLSSDELTGALARSCDLPFSAEQRADAAVSERWEAWRSVRLLHGCYWLHAWPDAEHSIQLFAAVADLPADIVSIAFLIEPSYTGTNVRCLIRIGALPDRYGAAEEKLQGIARSLKAGLSRLDGQHAPAVYASAPSGGGAR